MNFKPDSSSPEETKKREYLKQQHQLRTMNKSAVPLSADNMIETLLSKKEIFQKRTNQMENPAQKPQVGPWPVWLTPGREPSLYKDIWKLVGSPHGLADTNRLSSLLMTSRLTTETLGYIWSLSNVTVPGSLTQQELYINLALVALAQSGYTFANSNVIRQLKEAPLPALDVHILEAAPGLSALSPLAAPSSMLPSPGLLPATTAQSLEPPLPSPVPTITESISLLDISHEPLSLIDSSPTKSLAVLSAMDLGKDFPDIRPKEPNLLFSDFQTSSGSNDDDFDDFKSADIFSTEMNSLTVLDVLEPKVEMRKDSPKSDSGVEDLFPRCVIKPKSPDLMPSTDEKKLSQELGLLDDLSTVDLKNSGSVPAIDKSAAPTFPLSESLEPTSLTFDLGFGSTEGASHPSELNLGETSQNREPLSLEFSPIQLLPSAPVPLSSLPNVSTGLDNAPALHSMDPPQEDRYSALRLLDSGLFSVDESESREGEDFGDFLTADVPARSRPSHSLKDTDDDIQIKCLEACLKLLQEAVTIFENIEDPKVLDEVASNERGKSYLREILEVERIGRRIRSSRETCDRIIEFETLSKILQPYIEYVKNNHLEEQDGPKCGICFCERGPAHVKYGINHFHAPCANLYLHLVDPILPIAPVM